MNTYSCTTRFLFALVVVCSAVLINSWAQAPPSPESVLGHKPGDDFYLASYDESLDYFQKLSATSNKIDLRQVGKTSGGLDWYLALISSPENLRNLDRYIDIGRRVARARGLSDEEARQLAREGKVIVHIDGALHSTEVAHGQHTIQLAYNLVTDDSAETRHILDNVILVLWFSINPDGQNMVVDWYRRNLGTPYEVSPMPWLYQKYVGHDNNRDGYMNNMIESQVVTRVTVNELFPMVFYNHHQTAPFPTRIWIPPFAEPVSTNMHPLMWRWTSLFGTAMAAYLDAHNMPGSTHRGRGFDNWYPGFIDNVNNYRHTISFLTETALYRYATPHFYTVQDFPESFRDLRKEVFYSSPWEGGWWRLGDAVRYMLGASMSVLDTAAKYREQIIYNRYQCGRDVIRQFSTRPPFAYLMPQGQADPQTAALLLQKLRLNGIEISQAEQAFRWSDRDYPAGTWVIWMDQPFALLAKELLEVQNYPDIRESEGGEPDLPYDVAGWTLPLQMRVEVIPVTTPIDPDLRNKTRALTEIRPPAGSIDGNGNTFLIDHRSNVSITAINRILKSGGRVSLADRQITTAGRQYDPGTFVVTDVRRDALRSISEDLSLQIRATQGVDGPTRPITAPRIGIYGSWEASIDEGWTRWLLEQYEFPFTVLRNDHVKAGHLRDQFDVIVIAEMSAESIMEGRRAGSVPGEFAGGIGDRGLAHLREFVTQGGTLVTLGNSSAFAIEHFKLPVKDGLGGLRRRDFFCGGSILKTEPVDSSHPLLYGLASNPAVFFARNAAFETQRGFKGSMLLQYPKEENPLLSGFILGPEKIQGKIAALDVHYGSGHIVLSGFRPQWRGQTHGMFKFLFNSLFHFGPAAAVEDRPSATSSGGDLGDEWAKLQDNIQNDLKNAFDQSQKFASARGSQAAAEGKRFDEIVQTFQTTRLAELNRLKQRVENRTARGKLDEYTTQLKAALVDMRGKDFSLAQYTLDDLRTQFRLESLEKDISALLN